MSNTLIFIHWSKFGVDDVNRFGGKAVNLAELTRLGFPVPEAVVISTDTFGLYKETGIIDPNLIKQLEVIRQTMGGKVALRSSATCEDGQKISMAGVFETVYLKSQDQSVEMALKTIFDQALSKTVSDYLTLQGSEDGQMEMAVIMQKLIEPDLSGVIYTDVGDDDTLIQYTSGFGNRLVDGEAEGSSVIFSASEQKILKSKNTDLALLPKSMTAKLDACARQIRTAFGNLPQDIEFAIEAGEIYILQARTLTTEIGEINFEMSQAEIIKHTKEKLQQIIDAEKLQLNSDQVILSDSNFSELLPRPREMDFGVFAYIFTGSDGVPGAIQLGRAEMGYPLGDESVGYMHFVGGKPYFSVAKDAHTFYAGFPETRSEYNQTLVKEYLQKIEADPEKGEYPEMGLYLQDPTFEGLANRYGVEKAEQYFQVYQQFSQRMTKIAEQFMIEYLSQGKPATDEFIREVERQNLADLTPGQLTTKASQILEHLRTKSCVNFVKSARLGFYYSQRLQAMLQEHLGMDSDLAAMTYAKLNQGLDGSEITTANLKIAAASTFDEALEIGRTVVGHYSTGEMLEIRHPRLKDDEHALCQYVAGIYDVREAYGQEFEQQKSERLQAEKELSEVLDTDADLHEIFFQVLRATQTYMSLRETVKYQFVKEYALLRDVLVELAKRAGVEESKIFSLFPREIFEFTLDPESFITVIAERIERFDKYPLLNLPAVIRESDLESLGENEDEAEAGFELFGKLLAQGQALAEAIIVNLEDFATVEAAREILLFYRNQALPIVLVASQLNLSHDPLIAQADGLIIENAGLVSHGAQRARELGRGAIGGIRAKSLKTGERVSFDPQAKSVTKKSN